MRSIIISIACLLFFIPVEAQQTYLQDVQGVVLDAADNEPLAFVNIVLGDRSIRGATSDINGRFQLEEVRSDAMIEFRFVGYSSKQVRVAELVSKNVVYMSRSAAMLPEFEVTPGVNPALGVMQKVRTNKKRNNPLKTEAFTCEVYNKVIFDYVFRGAPDSVRFKIEKSLKSGHLMLMESVSELKHKAPSLLEEKVVASRISGFKKQELATMINDFQPFGFYEDEVVLLQETFLNPIADDARTKYVYSMRDTLLDGEDSVFIIAFYPVQSSDPRLLKGVLYIHSNGFAIRNVRAEPSVQGLIDLRVQQNYINIDGQWFPDQLDFELEMKEYPSEKIGLKANGKSTVSNIDFPRSDTITVSYLNAYLDPMATARDSAFWNEKRPTVLSSKEQTTYEVIDSIGEQWNFDAIGNFTSGLNQLRIPIRFVDWSLKELLTANQHERARLGLALYTNDKFMKRLELGGYVGYGIRDEKWKYAASAAVFIKPEIGTKLNVKYKNTLKETRHIAEHSEDEINVRNLIREYMGSRMDRVEAYEVSVESYTVRYLKANAYLRLQSHRPLYQYAFLKENGKQTSFYRYTEIGLQLRYAYAEKRMQMGRNTTVVPSKYPIFNASIARGLSALDGMFDYIKADLGMRYSFRLPYLRTSNVVVTSGFVNTALPVGMLYTGQGAFSPSYWVYVKEHPQTMRPYEFLSDGFIAMHLRQEIAQMTLKPKWTQPRFSLVHYAAVGDLDKRTRHIGLPFKTMEKGFYEAGLIVDDIVKYKYVNMFYVGLGMGVHSRYGPYSFPEIERNIAVKINLNISFR
ncbi:MAG: DUF5686 family protein [Salibacteraceae bacterium]